MSSAEAIRRYEAPASLCLRAPIIVTGEITGMEGQWREDGGIQTLVDFSVQHYWKGQGGSSLPPSGFPVGR